MSPTLRAGGGAEAVSVMDAASIGVRPRGEGPGSRPAGRGGPGPAAGGHEAWLADGRGLDHLVEDELAALDAVSAVVRQRGVAVLVDRVLAEDRTAVLDLEERVDDGLLVVALVTGVLDRLEGDAHRLVPVDRVRLGVR